MFTEILNFNISPIFMSKRNLIGDIWEKVFHYPLVTVILCSSTYDCVYVCIYQSEQTSEWKQERMS